MTLPDNPTEDISIHAPLAGSDTTGDSKPPETRGFQSTLPLRGATSGHQQSLLLFAISIHAPLAGSDLEATSRRFTFGISIHAPLAGSDCNPHRLSWWRLNFNPRSPCGERLLVQATPRGCMIFQSTLPLRGATVAPAPIDIRGDISIHAPLAGSDLSV